jgi:hypothetical protein
MSKIEQLIYMVDSNNNKLRAYSNYAELEYKTGIDSFDAKKSACGLEVSGLNVRFVEKKFK